MIRPRVGDFVYSNGEVETMREDIRVFKQAGVSGVVFGLLNPAGSVNVEATVQQVAFHNYMCRLTQTQIGRRRTSLTRYAALLFYAVK